MHKPRMRWLTLSPQTHLLITHANLCTYYQGERGVRFRILNSNGHMRNNVWNLHGHYWQDEPYTNNSKAIGSNPFSEFKGAQYGIGPSSHYEVIPVNGAGGARRVAGDNL